MPSITNNNNEIKMKQELIELLGERSKLPPIHKKRRVLEDIITTKPMEWDDIISVCSLYAGNLNTDQIAHGAGVSTATVRNISNGKPTNMSSLEAVLGACGANLAAVFIFRLDMPVDVKAELFLRVLNETKTIDNER